MRANDRLDHRAGREDVHLAADHGKIGEGSCEHLLDVRHAGRPRVNDQYRFGLEPRWQSQSDDCTGSAERQQQDQNYTQMPPDAQQQCPGREAGVRLLTDVTIWEWCRVDHFRHLS